jgi:hypothetical protein
MKHPGAVRQHHAGFMQPALLCLTSNDQTDYSDYPDWLLSPA